MGFVRAFLGVELSIPSARAVVSLARLLRTEIALPGLRHRWVHPQNLHITLKFLGSTHEETLEAVVGLLRRRLEWAPRPAIPVQTVGLGAFPSLKAPRVLFAEVLDPSGTFDQQ